MAFWSDKKWKVSAPKQSVIDPFDAQRVEAANYLLSIGDEVYVSEPGKGSVVKKLKDGENFYIEPGQFAFLLTRETVRIPKDTLGFISIRARIKFLGLVNISGFHVDPGYHGKLVFSVFNAGPARIQLKQGDDIFPVWLADLDGDTTKGSQSGYLDIPSKILTPISGDFTTAYQVSKQLVSLADKANGLDKRLSESESAISILKSRYYIYGGIILFLWSLFMLFAGPPVRNYISDAVSSGSSNLNGKRKEGQPLAPEVPPLSAPSKLEQKAKN